jgi:hypothetical protein
VVTKGSQDAFLVGPNGAFLLGVIGECVLLGHVGFGVAGGIHGLADTSRGRDRRDSLAPEGMKSETWPIEPESLGGFTQEVLVDIAIISAESASRFHGKDKVFVMPFSWPNLPEILDKASEWHISFGFARFRFIEIAPIVALPDQ